MRILNLYAGIGGNRKLWGDEHQVTAVENVDYIADVYAHFYPADTLVREDAHQYLLDHHKEFDFIWSSPPCPSHSRFNTSLYAQGYIRYPDMRLYQEILFLKHFFKGKWVVENVEPYYKPLIMPRTLAGRHLIWSNFEIPKPQLDKYITVEYSEPNELQAFYKISDFPRQFSRNERRTMLRNMVDPEIGYHILKAALKETKQEAML